MRVRPDILRAYQSIHLWTGIIAALVLFIAFYGGALTMFKSSLNEWTAPPARVLNTTPTAQLDDLIAQVALSHPGVEQGFTLHLANHKDNLPPIRWHENKVGRELDINAQQWQATLNEKGQLHSQKIAPSAMAELIDLLHQTAGIPGHVGHERLGVLILGAASVLYFLALVSGVIILLPTLVKTLFALRRNKGESRLWLDTHNILGITSLPFHIVMSLTAVVFAFHDPMYDSLKTVVYGDKPMFGARAELVKKDYQFNQLQSVEQLIKRADTLAPDFDVTAMTFINLKSPRPMVRLSLYNPTQTMRGPETDYAYYHAYSGELVNSTLLPGEQGLWQRTVATFFALHFGSYGGNFVRWMYFAMGIAGAVIFYSGNLLWLEKRRKKLKKRQDPATQIEQSKASHIMASATVGVCLGSMAALICAMVIGKWLTPWVSNVNPYYLVIYYSLFAASLGWAFYQGAAKSAIHLLRLCGLAALAMPLTSVVALIFPQTRLWAPELISTIAVDLVALLSAMVFLLMAKRAQQRALNGPKDSVWALKGAETNHVASALAQT